jgi:hypothetical protein
MTAPRRHTSVKACKDSERAPSKAIVQLFEQVRRRIKTPRLRGRTIEGWIETRTATP